MKLALTITGSLGAVKFPAASAPSTAAVRTAYRLLEWQEAYRKQHGGEPARAARDLPALIAAGV